MSAPDGFVPLTIVGRLFMIVAYLPFAGWGTFIAPYLPLLQVPVTATFGLLAVFVCFAIGYDLGRRLEQEAIVSATMATVVFLMMSVKASDLSLSRSTRCRASWSTPSPSRCSGRSASMVTTP